MTARVLVVDDILANVKLLEARLSAEYFEVLTAYNGRDAIEICEADKADIVLLDVMMPEMDGYEVCRHIKSNSKTQHIPVIMVTALDQPSEKIKGLDAGADDFLTKPVDDIALVTRVKNLSRLKTLTDEMIMRANTSEQLGVVGYETSELLNSGEGGRIMLVEDSDRSANTIVQTLKSSHTVDVEPDIQNALITLPDGGYDLLIVSLNLKNADGLRLCSQVRSLNRIRHLPILVMIDPGENARLLRGLEMGVNDYLVRPIEKNELFARVKTQIKRKQYSDYLSSIIEEKVEMAITDALTGLHNRHYMERHMQALVVEAAQKQKPLSLLVSDIDYFKSINDTYGHNAGDAVLQEFANRLKSNARSMDLVCRFGGEEFVIVMPDTDLALAYTIAERLRKAVADTPFLVEGSREVEITASMGISTFEGEGDTPLELLERADKALYQAKRDGRNRVVADAA